MGTDRDDMTGPAADEDSLWAFLFFLSFSYQMEGRGQGVTRAWQALSLLDGIIPFVRQPRPRQAEREKREKKRLNKGVTSRCEDLGQGTETIAIHCSSPISSSRARVRSIKGAL